MKTFDELLAMTEAERLEYLETEVNTIINNAPDHLKLKLRAVHAKCNGIRRTVHNPLVRASKIQGLMLDSMFELKDLWDSLGSIAHAYKNP